MWIYIKATFKAILRRFKRLANINLTLLKLKSSSFWLKSQSRASSLSAFTLSITGISGNRQGNSFS
jgi:hypothetical protein